MFEGDYDDTGGSGSFQLRPGEYSSDFSRSGTRQVCSLTSFFAAALLTLDYPFLAGTTAAAGLFNIVSEIHTVEN